MVRSILVFLGILWASPYTFLGLLLGLLGLLTGGQAQIRGRAIEFHGGLVRWLVARLPPGPTTLAVTLGHTILGQTASSLDIARRHEAVHIRQYERWGPLMGVVYLGSSLCLWIAGRDPYRDNPFERQAFAEDDVSAS